MSAILRLLWGMGACCVQLHCGTVLLTNFDLVSGLSNFIIANKRRAGASPEDCHSRTTSKWPIARKKRQLYLSDSCSRPRCSTWELFFISPDTSSCSSSQLLYNDKQSKIMIMVFFSVSGTGYSGVEPITSWLLVHIHYHWTTIDSWELGLN